MKTQNKSKPIFFNQTEETLQSKLIFAVIRKQNKNQSRLFF